MILIFYLVYFLAGSVFYVNCFVSPNGASFIARSNIPNQCKQLGETATRIVCLTEQCDLISWNLNGSGKVMNQNWHSANKISYFQVTPDNSSIAFFENFTFSYFELDPTTLSVTKNLSLSVLNNTGYPLSGALKISNDVLLVTVIKLDSLGWMHENWLYRYNMSSGSVIGSRIVMTLGDKFFMKMSPNGRCVVFWETGGKNRVYYLERGEMEMGLNQFPVAWNIVKFNLQYNDMFFSGDGTHLGAACKSYFQLAFYRQTIVNGQIYLRKYSSGIYNFYIYHLSFWSSNDVIGIFNGSLMSFYSLSDTTWTYISDTNYGFSQDMTVVSPSKQVVVVAYGSSLNVDFYGLTCQSGYYFDVINQLYCVDHPPPTPVVNTTNTTNNTATNITSNTTTNTTSNNTTSSNTTSSNTTNSTTNTTNTNVTNSNITAPTNTTNNTSTTNTTTVNGTASNTTSNTTSNATSNVTNTNLNITNTTNPVNTTSVNTTINNTPNHNTSVSYALSTIISVLLQTKATQSLNQLPASRRILRPIFAFFSNFDDLQLYNYLNINFSSTHQDMFNQIQQLEQEKWNLIHFNKIWYNSFGVDLNPLQAYFNDTHRIQYTSDRFLALQGSAGGYILNTLQFYFSNFILNLAVFSLGYMLFYLLRSFKVNIFTWFTQFKVWIAFPIFLFEGNIQYMTYLIGFQLKNLWSIDYYRKFGSVFVINGFFIIVFGLSMIYFFIKYFLLTSTKEFFEVCRPNIKGIFYMNFIFGIKNVTFGLAHQMLNETNDFICFKLAFLIFIESFCLVWSVHLSTENFFISKIRQWIFMFTSLIRIFIAMSYILNVWSDETCDEIKGILSDLEAMLMIFFISFWPVMVALDVSLLAEMVGSKLRKYCSFKSEIEDKKIRFAQENGKDFKKIGEERNKVVKVSFKMNHVDYIKTKKSNMEMIKHRLHNHHHHTKKVIQTLADLTYEYDKVQENDKKEKNEFNNDLVNQEVQVNEEGLQKLESGSRLIVSKGSQNGGRSLHYLECRYATGASEGDQQRELTIMLKEKVNIND